MHSILRDEAAYAEAHVALLSFDFGVLPIDQATHALLASNKAIDPEATLAEVAKFCEQNLKVEDAKAIFAAARLSAKT